MKDFRAVMRNGARGNVITLPLEFIKKARLTDKSKLVESIEGKKLILSRASRKDKKTYSVIRHNERFFRATLDIEWIKLRKISPKDRVSVKIIGEAPAVSLVIS